MPKTTKTKEKKVFVSDDTTYEIDHTPSQPWEEEYNMPCIEKDGHKWIRMVDHEALLANKIEIDEVVVGVIRAWEVEGPNPQYHREMKRKLKEEWPSLYKAVDSLKQKLLAKKK